jgi:hypothetical protein
MVRETFQPFNLPTFQLSNPPIFQISNFSIFPPSHLPTFQPSNSEVSALRLVTLSGVEGENQMQESRILESIYK